MLFIIYFIHRVPELFASYGGSPHNCVTAIIANLKRYITCSQRRQPLALLFATQILEDGNHKMNERNQRLDKRLEK